MESRLLAILRQDNHEIGLFDPLCIHQEFQGTTQQIYWFRSYSNPLSVFVSPRVLLSPDPVSLTIHSSRILVLDAERPILNQWGAIRLDQLYNSTLVRIPYMVQFWEDTDFVPVYTLFPDYSLPWIRTLRSSVQVANPILRPFQRSLYPSLLSPPRPPADLPPLPTDATCPITFEILTVRTAYWTPCQHVFSIAILQALELNPRCPLCRRHCSTDDCRQASL